MLVGPKGSGKTTLSTAIAIRGHAFLGDETAAYRASDGAILPMRRPMSVKPGVRSREMNAQLEIRNHAADEDGILHVPAREIFEAQASSVKLAAVVFLDGFSDQPSIAKI